MSVQPEQGGVCAPQGFLASAVHCGLLVEPEHKDLSLIYSRVPCACGVVYTENKISTSPLQLTSEHFADGKAHGVLCLNGVSGLWAEDLEVGRQLCKGTAKELNLSPQDLGLFATGPARKPIPSRMVERSLPALKAGLSAEGGERLLQSIATPGHPAQEFALSFQLGGKFCTMGGLARGGENTLVILTTDVDITSERLQKALTTVLPLTFQMLGLSDPSPGDMILFLANGLSGNAPIIGPSDDYDAFLKPLSHLCIYLARMLVMDGPPPFMECMVTGTETDGLARSLAMSVVRSASVRRALFQQQADWGRILTALGNGGVEINPLETVISLASSTGRTILYQKGAGIPASREEAEILLLDQKIELEIQVGSGDGGAVAWSCGLE